MPQLMNLKETVDNDFFFGISKNMYKNEKAKIDEEYKLRKEWIKNYSVQPKLDMQMLKEWKEESMKKLNHSDISPEARKAVKQYLKEQQELADALDRDEAKQESLDHQEDVMMEQREQLSACWTKVDELEQVWYDTYMNTDDDEFGKLLFKQAKGHLDQQVKECN